MAFQYTILPDQNLILVRFEGPVSVSDFTASASAICSDKRYIRGADGLIDLTHISVTISLQDIKELVHFTLSKHKHGHGRWAVLVTTPISTAFTVLFQQGVTHQHPFTLFCTLDAASSFLERPIDADFLNAELAS